jgi:hypothetical protein
MKHFLLVWGDEHYIREHLWRYVLSFLLLRGGLGPFSVYLSFAKLNHHCLFYFS